MSQPFRVTPNLPVGAYTTYALTAPKETHSRPATCEEVDCEPFLKGWVTRVPVNSPLAEYIASGTHGRLFAECRVDRTGEREFIFPPGQKCFRSTQHVIEIGRPPFATIRGGDWRGPTTQTRKVGLPEWVERFALNQQKIAETHEKGSI
jgi:hypothetical protein